MRLRQVVQRLLRQNEVSDLRAGEPSGFARAGHGFRNSGTNRMSTSGKRKYSPKASASVGRAMHEMKRGKLESGRSHRKVRNPKQAIAIGLSKARKEGAKAPAPSKKGSAARPRTTRASKKRRAARSKSR
jgi:hypothetical protein